MFSIVIPLYNKAPFIAATLASVQAQTFTDFEVLIVDDGSTDRSAEAAQQAIAGDRRFRYERVANGGVSAARNRGARLTSRPWLIFLDADDEWLPGFLQALADVIRQRPGLVLVSTTYLVRRADGQATVVDFGAGEAVSENYPFFDWSLRASSPAWTSATAVLRSAFEAAHGFDESMSLGEDLHLWVRLIGQGRYALLHRPLAIYDRGDPASLSRTLNARGMRSRLRLIDMLKRQRRSGQVPAAYVQAICEIHFCDLLAARAYRQAAGFWLSEWSLSRRAALRQVVRHLARRTPRLDQAAAPAGAAAAGLDRE